MTVIDVNTVGAGIDAAATAAVKAARTGISCDKVADVVRDVLQHCRLWLLVPKLDSLHRGGCTSAGQAMLSAALVIKPIAGIKDGLLALVARCRIEAKIKQHMVDFAMKIVQSASSTNRPPAVLLHHSDALGDVHEFQAMLAEGLPGNTRFRVLDLPEPLTAHVGQRACAVGTVSDGSIDSGVMDLEAEVGVIALLHSVEESDARAVDAEVVDTVDDDSGNTDNSGDSAGMDGSVENVGAADSGGPITGRARVKVVGNPVTSRNRNKRIHHAVVTNGQGIPLFTTTVSKLSIWSENRQAALDKAECLTKVISDLALRDKSDPEGVVFGAGGERSQEPSSSDKRDDDGDEKKK